MSSEVLQAEPTVPSVCNKHLHSVPITSLVTLMTSNCDMSLVGSDFTAFPISTHIMIKVCSNRLFIVHGT